MSGASLQSVLEINVHGLDEVALLKRKFNSDYEKMAQCLRMMND
jgi:hypothetical protein